MAALVASAGLAACTTALHGHASAGGGSTTSTGLAANAGAGMRAQASFGAPTRVHGAGEQAVFSRGASIMLVLGLVLADIMNRMTHGYAHDSQRVAAEPIADTCSCYRPQPQPAHAAAPTDEPDER